MLFATLFFAGASAVWFGLGATSMAAFHEFSQTAGMAMLALAAAFYVIGLSESLEVRQGSYYRGVALRLTAGIAPIVLFPLAAFVGVFALFLSLPVMVFFLPLLMRETIHGWLFGSEPFEHETYDEDENHELAPLVLRTAHR